MMKAKALCVLLVLFFIIYAEETSLSFLFQEALFIEETEGDIEKAIDQYNSILTIAKKDTTGDDDIQETISKTEYQLGICYLKLGQKEKAISQLKQVISTNDGHREVVNKAQKYLEEINPEFQGKEGEITMIPAPWCSKETMRFKIYTENGGEVGECLYTISDSKNEPNEIYDITMSEMIPVNLFARHSRMQVQKESFAPIESATKVGNHWNWNAKYTPKKIQYTSDLLGKETDNETVIDQQVFDYEQTLYLVRKLPLKVGYHDSAMVFTNTSGMYEKGQLQVIGMEDVKTELGTFSCYKAKISASIQGDKNYDQTIWVSNDKNRYIVKTKVDNLTHKLTAVYPVDEKSTSLISDDSLDIILELPADYIHYKSLTTMRYNTIYQIFSPKTMAWSLLTSDTKKKDISHNDIVDKEIKEYRKWYKKYRVKNDKWETTTINGIPVIKHIAEVRFNQNTPPVVEYRTHYFTKDNVHCLIFRTNKESFERDKEEFDRITELVNPL